MVNMQLTFLGTSAAVPTAERGLSSIAISRGSELLLFDAGEGMQRNFIKAGLGMNRKMKVFISHMHADHCLGLLGLLQTMSLQGREKPLHVFGLPTLEEFLSENMRIINFRPAFEVIFEPITKEGVVVEEQDYSVSSCNAKHSIPALSFCLREHDRPGVFDIDKAKTLEIPEGELYGRLQRGEDVKVRDRLIRSSDIVGPSRAGRKIGISGDTMSADHLVDFFAGCDLLVFESTYSDDMKLKAVDHYHSTASEAAQIAKAAGAKALYLTHFSARYDRTEELVREALRFHPNVFAAEDLATVEVPYPAGAI